MTRYILIPQRQGKSQRLTLPMHLLRQKGWLDVDCYTMKDCDGVGVTLTPYLRLNEECEDKPKDPDCSENNLIGDRYDD